MLTVLGWVTLAGALGLGVLLVRGLLALPSLPEPAPSADPPLVTIVVPARNEAATLGDAIPSMLEQSYPVEVIAVDDRSTDGTGRLLDRLAAASSSLRVLRVERLPEGWLGKNHALHRGAAEASGELLLFTDADVVMAPDAVGRAVTLLERSGLDHLAVGPHLHSSSGWVTVVVGVFLTLFSVVFQPWRAPDPRSRFHIGIGAFNLVRASAYRAVGGHRPIALRPDDDVRLGRILKAAGFRQAAASGRESLSVEWYASLPEMAHGLRKNAFAAVEYRLWIVVAASALPVLFVFWPAAALLLADGIVRWLNAGTLAAGMVAVGFVSWRHGLPPWVGVAYPVGSALLLWIVWSATFHALRTGSIEWRGTRYPLDDLRGPPPEPPPEER